MIYSYNRNVSSSLLHVSRLSIQETTEGKKKCAPPRPPLPKQLKPLIRFSKAQAPPVPLIAKQSVNLLTSAPPSSTLSSTNDLLINWDSPPTSPSITRSSSDGLSLQSFGSDSSSTTATGTNYPTRCESGFESESDIGWKELSANLTASFSAAAVTTGFDRFFNHANFVIIISVPLIYILFKIV